jgi:hypothetical protein
MPTHPITCPYCNAFVSVPEPPAGPRLECPRCGETFPYHGPAPGEVGPALPRPEVNGETAEAVPAPRPARRWSNRSVASIVLLLMGLMAVGALVLALETQGVRRAHDTYLPRERGLPERIGPFASSLADILRVLGGVGLVIALLRELIGDRRRPSARYLMVLAGGLILVGLSFLVLPLSIHRASELGPGPQAGPPPVHVTPPAELSALGYLPPETNIILAVHVAQALEKPAGAEFLRQFRVGPTDADLADLEKWTGLKPADIDHVVLGVQVDDLLLPRPILIAVSRRPYDAARLRESLRATRANDRGTKHLYRFRLEKAALNPVLWCASETAVVVTLTESDMDTVADKPAPASQHLAEPLRDLLKERVPAGTQVWLAGHSTSWETLQLFLSPFLPEKELNLFGRVRTFGAWLPLDRGLAFQAAFQCADEEAAQALEKHLARRDDGSPVLRLLGLRRDADPVSRELAETMKEERKDAWVTLEATASEDALRKALPSRADRAASR